MKLHRYSSTSIYLLIGTLLTIITNGMAFTCPEHCHCVEMHKKYTFNHVKCTSLDGLRILGKTSELHSLDLSSLNLTKINNQLDKLTNLSKLDLSDNRLSEINALSTKRIRVLNLSGNRMTSGKLSKIPATVKSLNLTNNDITILPDGFKRFIHLRSLELANNPLNCTCETLEIRNWLQERHVWTGKPILCMAPMQFKGWPWLAARQSEVCDPNGLGHESPRMLPSTMDNTADNDLMIGDDPNVNRHALNIAENDEGFLPVNSAKRAKRTDVDATNDSDYIGVALNDDGNDEGSGSSSTDDDDVYEGSGSEPTEVPITKPIDLDGNDQISNETQSDENDRSDDLITAHAPTNVSASETLDNADSEAAQVTTTEIATPTDQAASETIPVASANDDGNNDDSTVSPVVEETIVPVKNMANDAEYIQTHDPSEKDGSRSEESKIDESSSVHQGNSTYVLLAILGILLVALILFVAAKRSKANTKNRRNNNDIESPAQEMLTMDKNNLGKPMQNPVEFIPLIDPEKKTAVTAAVHNNKCNGGGEEPLLQKLTEVENQREPNLANGNGTHQLNGNAKPVANGINNDSNNRLTNENDQRQFQSISPKPSRYSPVYSHDTGRVKIKLSETSRPKTPILVTRSKANADENQYENTISQ